jgi:hypothetical protein
VAEARTEEDRHHRRLRRLVITGVALVVVFAAALGGFAYLWSRSGARPVGLDDARRRFLEDQVGREGPDGPYTPPEGVYAYTGSGSESLSSPPKSQSEGPEMPGTVTHGTDGCFTFRLDYSTNSYRVWALCADETGLRETGGSVFQRWDFVVSTIDTLEHTQCDPPAVVIAATMEPGDRWTSRCEGDNSAIEGTTVTETVHRFVGWDRVRVGNDTVDAMHFRDRGVVSDAQTGTESFDLWITSAGLIVRGRQHIVVDSDSPIGKVTYTQDGEFSLVRGTPEGASVPR